MSRFPLPMRAVASALIIGAGVLSSTFTVRPTSYNYGQVVVGSSKGQSFVVAFANTSGFTDTLVTQIVGPDAADFSVSLGGPTWVGATPPAGSCLLRLPRGSGTCVYVVDFNPSSVGKKTATLEITDMNGKGTTAQATLLGDGLFSCRPYLVHCNYADFYTGYITVLRVDSSIAGVNHFFRDEETVRVNVEQGVATCVGRMDKVEEDRSGGTVNKREVSSGPISGPGFVAVEWDSVPGAPAGRSWVYKLSFACPTASLTHTYVNNYDGTSGVSRTPADTAEKDQLGMIDEQTGTGISQMLVLFGKTLDITSEPVNDKGGYIKMEWRLTRQ